MNLRKALNRLWYGRPIVVVSGLPRSGTSMAMRMLEAGGLPLVTDGMRAADDDNPHGYFECERVRTLDKGGDPRWLADARGRGIKVVSALLPYLPEFYQYKVIFMRRDLREVLASQDRMLVHRGQAGASAGEEEMLSRYARHLERVDTLLSRRKSFEVLDVQYHEVVADPLQQATRMAAFVGGWLAEDRMAAAVSADLYRNRLGRSCLPPGPV